MDFRGSSIQQQYQHISELSHWVLVHDLLRGFYWQYQLKGDPLPSCVKAKLILFRFNLPLVIFYLFDLLSHFFCRMDFHLLQQRSPALKCPQRRRVMTGCSHAHSQIVFKMFFVSLEVQFRQSCLYCFFFTVEPNVSTSCIPELPVKENGIIPILDPFKSLVTYMHREKKTHYC